MILLIDNYDSFTYIIVQYLTELGAHVTVWKHDEYPASAIDELKPAGIVLSPGPGGPKDAGISLEVIDRFHATIPMLGICLGHQCLGHYFGGSIGKAPKIMHGKTSIISHDSSKLFTDIPSKFEVTRYHSLIIKNDVLPSTITQTAWAEEEEGKICMGIAHTKYPLYGVQFHPESYMSKHGHTLFNNFLRLLG